MEWIGCTVCEIFAFKLYCDLKTEVRGHSGSSKAALFDRAHTNLFVFHSKYPCLYLLSFPRYSHILVENRYSLVFGAPVTGEAVRIKQQPLVTKNGNDGLMDLSDSERISMICSAILMQSTRVTDGQTDRWTELP